MATTAVRVTATLWLWDRKLYPTVLGRLFTSGVTSDGYRLDVVAAGVIEVAMQQPNVSG
jgi:hypothetical protein